MLRDFADRAWLLGEQAGLRCETPPPSSVPVIRHHPRVLRRQRRAALDATGRDLGDVLMVAGAALLLSVLLWSC